MPFFYLYLPGTKIVTLHLRYIHTPVTQNQTIQIHIYLIASNYSRSCLMAGKQHYNKNTFIFLFLKTRCCKHDTLNIMYIKLHKIIMDKKAMKSMKI